MPWRQVDVMTGRFQFIRDALDRFADRAHQIVVEGLSLRAARAPSRAKSGRCPSNRGSEGG